MPLGMANVLQMSIFILAPQHLIPFISILPRYNVESISPLMLAFDNHGPGPTSSAGVKGGREF